MGDVVYTADIRIERLQGPVRRAYLPATAEPTMFGVHGAIADHYGVDPDEEFATTLDHVVAATGG